MQKINLKITPEQVKYIVENYINLHLLKGDLRAYATIISVYVPPSDGFNTSNCCGLNVDFETIPSATTQSERRVDLQL